MTTAILAGVVRMGPGEKLNLSISFVNRLSVGENLSGSAQSTLIDVTLGREHPGGLPAGPIPVSPVVSQMVSNLLSGHVYLLDILVNTSGQQTLEGQIEIICEGRPHLVL